MVRKMKMVEKYKEDIRFSLDGRRKVCIYSYRQAELGKAQIPMLYLSA